MSMFVYSRFVPPSEDTVKLAKMALPELDQIITQEYATRIATAGHSFGAIPSISEKLEQKGKKMGLFERAREAFKLSPQPLIGMAYIRPDFAWSDESWYTFLRDGLYNNMAKVSWFANSRDPLRIITEEYPSDPSLPPVTVNIRGGPALLIAAYYNVRDNFFLQLYLKILHLAKQTRRFDSPDINPIPDFENGLLNEEAPNFTLVANLEKVLIFKQFCERNCPEYLHRVIFACRKRTKGCPDIQI